MAFNNAFTAVVGATYTAAQYNTHVRDNFTAVWVYTAAGDIVYATSATTLARLAKGAAYQSLRMNAAGNAPEWGGYIAGMAYRGTAQTINHATATNVQFASAPISQLVTWSSGDNTKLSIGVTGAFLVGLAYTFENGGSGSGYREANIIKNGSTTVLPTRIPPVNGDNMSFSASDITILSNGDYLQLQMRQNNGASLDLLEAELFAIFFGA